MDGAQNARGLFFCLFSLVVLLRLVEVGEGGGGGGSEGAEGPGEEQEIAILVEERNSGRKEKMKGYINKNQTVVRQCGFLNHVASPKSTQKILTNACLKCANQLRKTQKWFF